jgi:hypothetical protein
MRSARCFLLFMAVSVVGALGFDGGTKDSVKAAETRKKLQGKISVEFTDTPLEEAMEELKSQVKGLGIRYDAGVSRNLPITFKGTKLSVADALAGMFKKNGFGYLVISKEGNAYDGNLLIKQGPERGYAAGEDLDKGDSKAKDKDAKKPQSGEKTAKKAKAAPQDAPENDEEKMEAEAARKVKFAKELIELGKKERAKERLTELVAKYGKTKAADEAREILKNWKDD